MTPSKFQFGRSRYKLGLVLLPALFFGASACGTPDLSQEEAKELIEESGRLSYLRQEIPYSGEGRQKGAQHNMWTYKSFMPGDNTELTAQGKEHFSSISNGRMVLNEAVAPLVITITGIAGEEEYREASFVWSYSQLPAPAKYYASQGGSGRATFRRYDDGWRLYDPTGLGYGREIVISVDTGISFPLSAQDRAQEVAMLAEMEEEKRIREEERRSRLEIAYWKLVITGPNFERPFGRGKVSATPLENGDMDFYYWFYDYDLNMNSHVVLEWKPGEASCTWKQRAGKEKNSSSQLLNSGPCDLLEKNQSRDGFTSYTFRTSSEMTNVNMTLEFAPHVREATED